MSSTGLSYEERRETEALHQTYKTLGHCVGAMLDRRKSNQNRVSLGSGRGEQEGLSIIKWGKQKSMRAK